MNDADRLLQSLPGGEGKLFLMRLNFEKECHNYCCCQLLLLGYGICSQPNVITQNTAVEPGPSSRQPMLLALWACHWRQLIDAETASGDQWRGILVTHLRISLQLKSGKNHRCHFFSSAQEVLLLSRGFVRARRYNSLQSKPSTI